MKIGNKQENSPGYAIKIRNKNKFTSDVRKSKAGRNLFCNFLELARQKDSINSYVIEFQK